MDRIELRPLTEEEMQEQGLTDQDVWMLKHDQELYGPFSVPMLKQDAHLHPELYSALQISNLAGGEWLAFHEAPGFKKRTPKLVSADTLAVPERFWVIFRGQRQGPYGLTHVQTMIQKGELTPNDLVSADEGATWPRVFEMKIFATVKHTADHLPKAPNKELLESRAKLNTRLTPKDGIASLAFLGGTSATTTEISAPTEIPVEMPIPSGPSGSGWGKRVVVLSGVVAVSFAAFFVWKKLPQGADMNTGAEVASAENSNNNDIELMPAGSSLLDEPRASKRKSSPRRRMPSSITQTSSLNVLPSSPPSMSGARQNMNRFQESHDGPQPASISEGLPENGGAYPDEGMPAELSGAESEGVREPSSSPSPNDDGYSMEGADAPAPVVEEVGDF